MLAGKSYLLSSLKMFFSVLDYRCWTGWLSRQRCRRGWMRSTLKSTWRVIRWDSSWKTHWNTAIRCGQMLSYFPQLLSCQRGFFCESTDSRSVPYSRTPHLSLSKTRTNESWIGELLVAENALHAQGQSTTRILCLKRQITAIHSVYSAPSFMQYPLRCAC